MDRITIVGESEDLEITVKRFGRHLIVTTERSSVARAIGRQIVESIAGTKAEEEEPRIGFQIE